MYEVIELGMAVEAGAGRNESIPAGTRVHKMKKKSMLKVTLTAKKSLDTMNYAEVWGASEELVRSYLSEGAS